MHNLSLAKIAYSPVSLMLLMLATRFHHFGSAIALPDASLSVFFLAGLWFSGYRLLGLLLLEAGLIDYIAITQMGVSSYCVSPAYVFLIPTYAALWFAGRYAQTKPNFIWQLGLLIGATLIAFALSNGSFYTLSGKFAELSFSTYASRVSQYLPPYLASTVAYSVVLVACSKLVKTMQNTQHSPQKTI